MESLQPMAFEELFNLYLQSQPRWFLFNGTWQKRSIELDHRLTFEIEVMTLQMQQAVHMCRSHSTYACVVTTYYHYGVASVSRID